jgi:hypothetical protein
MTKMLRLTPDCCQFASSDCLSGVQSLTWVRILLVSSFELVMSIFKSGPSVLAHLTLRGLVMKKFILATASVALFSAPALAAPITVSVGGYYNSVFYSVDTDDAVRANERSTSIQNDNEIIFKGKTKSNTGIEFGFQVQLEGEGADNSDHIDENYIYVKGDFGKLEMGAENSAAYKLQVNAPNFLGWKTYDNNFKTWSEVSNYQKPLIGSIDGDALKINYYTPKVNGLQIGLSHTPDVSDRSGDSDLYTENNSGSSTAYGVKYATTLQGVKVKLSYAATELDEDPLTPITRDDQSFGLSLSSGPWTFGGAATVLEFNGDDMDVLHYGVQYKMSPATKIGFAIHEQDGVRGVDTDSDIIIVGGSTKVAQGVRLTYSYEKLEVLAGDAEFIGLGLVMKF